VVYTTYSRSKVFAPQERKILSFILAKTEDGLKPEDVAKRINQETGLGAKTSNEFMAMTIRYYLYFTGIPINFGITAALGFLVGTAIAGQTFYNFTLENLKQFGALKAMGATNFRIVKMILLQALVVGVLGYGIGVGLACVFGWKNQSPPSDLGFFLRPNVVAVVAGLLVLLLILRVLGAVNQASFQQLGIIIVGGYMAAAGLAALFARQGPKGTELAFHTWWPILPITAAAVILICFLSSLLCIYRVVALEPAVVFRG
jgi:putative ABC transport system permease protein